VDVLQVKDLYTAPVKGFCRGPAPDLLIRLFLFLFKKKKVSYGGGGVVKA